MMYHDVARSDFASETERRSSCPWACVDDEWFHLSALLMAMLAAVMLFAVM